MKKIIQPIEIFDATIRDGTQGKGVNLSVDDKLRLTSKLDEFGINIIEASWQALRDSLNYKLLKSKDVVQTQ